MITVESLKRQIQVAEDLHSVVKTMKSLAAVNIRQYEEAVRSLGNYIRTVEDGFRILLQQKSGVLDLSKQAPRRCLGAVVLGSDQGMCGQLNDLVAQHALRTFDELSEETPERIVLAMGVRVASRLEDAGEKVEMGPEIPGSIDGISSAVQDILFVIDGWLSDRRVDHVILFYATHSTGIQLSPETHPLLPIDQQWLNRLAQDKWPTRAVPYFTMDSDRLFSALVHQYLFISIHRGIAEALASENASRLASMQGAERNIEQRLGELTMDFHQQRQAMITSELLDIVSGFEALSDGLDT